MNKATKQDIEATIKILKGRFGKFYSFLLLWYPFRGSVKDHILYLKNKLRDDLRLIDIIPKQCFVIESCPCGLIIGIKKDILGTGVETRGFDLIPLNPLRNAYSPSARLHTFTTLLVKQHEKS